MRWTIGLSLGVHVAAVIGLLWLQHGSTANRGPGPIQLTMVFGQPEPATSSPPARQTESTMEAPPTRDAAPAPPTHDAAPSPPSMPEPPARSELSAAPPQPPIVPPQAAIQDAAPPPPDKVPPETVPPPTISPQTSPLAAAPPPRVVPQPPEPKPVVVPRRPAEPERKPVSASTRAVAKPLAQRSQRSEQTPKAAAQTAMTHARPTRTADAAAGRPDAPASDAGSGASSDQRPTQGVADPSWLADVSAWLRAHRSYPEMARALGRQGTVLVQVTVNPAGRVVRFNLLRGSGSQSLDQAAEALMRNAQLPPFPPDMRLPRQSLTVPIHYQLD